MRDPAAIEALRAQIRVLEGGPRVARRRVETGVSHVDSVLGGLPEPGIVEVSGPVGAGRSRWLLPILRETTRSGQVAAWIDPLHRVYPPALAAAGVVLDRLLLVRPPEDGSAPWVWATEQLLRSGCFSRVVVDLPPRSGSRRSASHRWARSAERGCATALVLSERPTRELPADVRISVGENRWTVVRDRGRSSGGGGRCANEVVGRVPAGVSSGALWLRSRAGRRGNSRSEERHAPRRDHAGRHSRGAS